MDKNYFGITDTGKVRDNNEDTFIAETTADGKYIIACVIDGVGGYSGGEIAADIARQSILQHLAHPSGDFTALMKQAILVADTRIMAEKQKTKGHEGMACVLTLAVVDVDKNLLYYAHVGDTRLYLLRDQSLVKISKDQSFVGFMEDSGRLTEEQAMKHPKRNEINKALGFGANIGQEDYIEIGQSPFLPGDAILLCSDGLSDMINKEDMTAILLSGATLDAQGTALIAKANQNGGLDNITVVLVRNMKQRAAHEVLKPAVKPSRAGKAGGAGLASGTETRDLIAPETEEEKITQVPVQVTWTAADLATSAAPAPRSNKWLVGLLSVLCVVLLAGCLYLLWLNHVNANQIRQQKLNTFKNPRNPQEKLLQDTLNRMKGNTLVLTDSLFKSPIVISEPLQFNKDTLFLIADSGMVLKSDTAFKGKAILIQPASKFVYLENISFEDFNTVISSQNNALTLKNVRFINSPNAIETIYNFPMNKYINGKISRSTFRTDSLATPK